MMARFWWGSEEGKRKVHWASWRKVCVSKFHGGLAFRDLELFNKALLAKHGWRLIEKPDSLLARVLKGKYFNQVSFLDAKPKSNSSYIWKSLLWERSLLEVEVKWRVGDGNSIRIAHDNWVPRPPSLQIIHKNAIHPDVMVGSLLNPDGLWNEDLIRVMFGEEDAMAILGILRPRVRHSDKIMWHYEKDGRYSVRSGYKMACVLREEVSSSNSEEIQKWWKFVWAC